MKNNKKLILIVSSVLILITLILVSFFYYMNVQNRFNKFLFKLSDSTIYAASQHGADIEYNGSSYRLIKSNCEKLYSWTIAYGPGKEVSFDVNLFERYAKVDYGDGAIYYIGLYDGGTYLVYYNGDYEHTIKVDARYDSFVENIFLEKNNIPKGLN